jgi:hypothetical protein
MSLEARLEAIVRASPAVMTVLTVLRELDFPQWRLVSGAVYQTVWNDITGRPADHGLRDFDVMYFDPDTAWDAEDAFIRRAAAAFAQPLSAMVEVRNQARVHLWFEGKFAEPYSPLSSTDEAVERFLAPAFAVGLRLEPDGRLDILAPFGLEDCFDMRLRPNPRRPVNSRNLPKVADKLMARWPELTLDV